MCFSYKQTFTSWNSSEMQGSWVDTKSFAELTQNFQRLQENQLCS